MKYVIMDANGKFYTSGKPAFSPSLKQAYLFIDTDMAQAMIDLVLAYKNTKKAASYTIKKETEVFD